MNTKQLFDELVKRFPGEDVVAGHTMRNTHTKEPEYYGAWVGDYCAFTDENTPIEKLAEKVAAKIPTHEQLITKAREAAQRAKAEVARLQAELKAMTPEAAPRAIPGGRWAAKEETK